MTRFKLEVSYGIVKRDVSDRIKIIVDFNIFVMMYLQQPSMMSVLIPSVGDLGRRLGWTLRMIVRDSSTY